METAALKELKPIAAVFLAYFLVLVVLYWTTLNGGPLIDDFRLLDTAKHGGWLANFPATTPVVGLFWRPMISILLKAEWSLFHLNFAGYRLVSAALCALTAVSIYAVINNLTQSRKAAVVAGLFFILWPSHPETVVWIAGQTDGLATCLSWLALWAFLINRQKPPWRSVLWLAPLIAALLAKESAVVMPFLILAIAITLPPSPSKGQKAGRVTLSASMLALTFGYLWSRSQMLHQSLLGGGYQTRTSRSLPQGVLSGLLNYHLSLNLLNAYAPLSNRFFTGVLGWAPESLVAILIVFGVGAVIRQLPRSPRRNPIERRLTPFALAANLLIALGAVFGPYPLAFLLSVAEIPMGLLAIVILLALATALAYKNKAQIGAQARFIAANNATLKIPVVALAACVVHEAALSRVAQQTVYVYAASFWLILFLTRPLKTAVSSPIPKAALVFAFASVVALIPILTIRQVDDNLALARLSYLATTFSVPALVLGITAVAHQKRVKQLTLAAVGLILLTALVPVVQTWTRSVRVSKAYVEALRQSKAQRIYVLASPGIVPSATTFVLGGPFLDASGKLVRDDNPQVIPAYYADSFTAGDHLQIDSIGDETWRVSAVAGKSKNRSGNLLLLPCFQNSPTSSFQSKIVPGNSNAVDVTIKDVQPSDLVLGVTERGVLQVSRRAAKAP